MATIQEWRDFFSTAPNNSTVFDVLDHAITVAASDFPEEFSQRKDRILSSISETASGPVEPPKPWKRIIRLKIRKPKAKDQEELIKPTCDGEAKPIERKACMDEKAIEAKLEATKRKMHGRYEDIEMSKKQKRIQVLDYVPEQKFNKLACPAKPQRKSSSARRPVAKKLGAQSLLSRLVAC